MRKIIIDTDPGIDDAAAIAIAMFSPELDVQLITTVSGNVSVEKNHPQRPASDDPVECRSSGGGRCFPVADRHAV